MLIHLVDAASTEGRDPVEDIYKINKELEAYDPEMMKKPQVIAANKIDAIYPGDEDPVERLRKNLSPRVSGYSGFCGKRQGPEGTALLCEAASGIL